MQKARCHNAIGVTPTVCKHTVSGTISLPCSGCFSPFLHSTCSLSVSQEYLALPDGPGRFRQDSSCPALLRILLTCYNLTCTGLSPPMVFLSRKLPLHCNSYIVVLQPHFGRNQNSLGFSHFARHYSENHSCFLLLRLLRCFSSAGLPHTFDVVYRLHRYGLPHSDIRGSQVVCTSPQLFAAYHVLLRL
jgi:hypothetical protein